MQPGHEVPVERRLHPDRPGRAVAERSVHVADRRSGPRRGDVLLQQLQGLRVGVEALVDDVPAARRQAQRRQRQHAIGLGERLARVLAVGGSFVSRICRPVGRLGADLLVRRPALRAPVLRRPRSVVLVVRDVMSVLVGHDLLRRRLVELIIGSGVDRVGVGVVAGERLVAAVLTRLDGRERHQVQRQQRELRTVWERAEVRRPTLRQRLVDGIAVGDDDVNGGAGGVAGRVRAVPRERGCGKHERDESDEEHLLHGPQTALKWSGAREPPVKVDR